MHTDLRSTSFSFWISFSTSSIYRSSSTFTQPSYSYSLEQAAGCFRKRRISFFRRVCGFTWPVQSAWCIARRLLIGCKLLGRIPIATCARDCWRCAFTCLRMSWPLQFFGLLPASTFTSPTYSTTRASTPAPTTYSSVLPLPFGYSPAISAFVLPFSPASSSRSLGYSTFGFSRAWCFSFSFFKFPFAFFDAVPPAFVLGFSCHRGFVGVFAGVCNGFLPLSMRVRRGIWRGTYFYLFTLLYLLTSHRMKSSISSSPRCAGIRSSPATVSGPLCDDLR